MDYFRVPGNSRVTLAQWNLVVDRNLDAFSAIIEAKYERGDWDVHSAYGQSYPRLTVTLEDMRRSGEQFTIEVLKLDAGFQQIRLGRREEGARYPATRSSLAGKSFDKLNLRPNH